MQYAPGIQDQSANIIMQGNALSQRQGEDMTKIAGYFMERSQKADALRKTLEAYGGVDDEGEPLYNKKITGGMNVDQLEGTLKGLALVESRTKMQAQAEEERARAESYRAIAAERQDRIDQAEVQGKAFSRYFNAPEIKTELPAAGINMFTAGAAPAPFDINQPQMSGTTVSRPRTHFEKIAYAVGPEGVSGKFAAPTIKALESLKDLTGSAAGELEVRKVPGTDTSIVRLPGSNQTFEVHSLAGLEDVLVDADGQKYVRGPRGGLLPVAGGAGSVPKVATFKDLNDAYKLRQSIMADVIMTAEQKQLALDDVNEEIRSMHTSRAAAAKGGAKAGATAAAPGTPASDAAATTRSGVATKGAAPVFQGLKPVVKKPKVYKTAKEIASDQDLSDEEAAALIQKQFGWRS